ENSTLTTRPPSPLPQPANANFDGAGGWIELQNEAPFQLICSTTSCPIVGITIPSAPQVAWLGGAVAGVGTAITHRLYQSISLPADYDVQLSFNFFTQSAETACGVDSAGVFINDVPVYSAFALCSEQALPAWR